MIGWKTQLKNLQYKSGLEFVALFQSELIYSKLISVS